MSMTLVDTAALGRRFFEDTLGNGNWADARDFVSQDVVMHHPSSIDPIAGYGAFSGFLSQFRNGFSDFNMKAEDVVGAGDKVTVRWHMRGTQDGELFGIPPTGKKVDIQGISLLRFEDGKIVEDWVAEDTIGLMRQLGVINL